MTPKLVRVSLGWHRALGLGSCWGVVLLALFCLCPNELHLRIVSGLKKETSYPLSQDERQRHLSSPLYGNGDNASSVHRQLGTRVDGQASPYLCYYKAVSSDRGPCSFLLFHFI